MSEGDKHTPADQLIETEHVRPKLRRGQFSMGHFFAGLGLAAVATAGGAPWIRNKLNDMRSARGQPLWNLSKDLTSETKDILDELGNDSFADLPYSKNMARAALSVWIRDNKPPQGERRALLDDLINKGLNISNYPGYASPIIEAIEVNDEVALRLLAEKHAWVDAFTYERALVKNMASALDLCHQKNIVPYASDFADAIKQGFVEEIDYCMRQQVRPDPIVLRAALQAGRGDIVNYCETHNVSFDELHVVAAFQSNEIAAIRYLLSKGALKADLSNTPLDVKEADKQRILAALQTPIPESAERPSARSDFATRLEQEAVEKETIPKR